MYKILTAFFILTACLFADTVDSAKRNAQSLIREKERELKSQDISQNERDYLLDLYKIDIVSEAMQDLDSSTKGINDSIGYAYDEYDKLLNKYYKLYRDKLNDEEKKVFLEEQRAWLKVRDAYFEYVGAHYNHVYTAAGGGSIYSIMASNMRLQFLTNRVKELFDYYDKGVDDVY